MSGGGSRSLSPVAPLKCEERPNKPARQGARLKYEPLGHKWRYDAERRFKSSLRVLEEFDLRVTDLNRHCWSIAKSFQTRKLPKAWKEGFYNKHAIINPAANPGVPPAVSARSAHNETGLVPKIQQLLPSPKGEIVTIASMGLLELLGWHPVVLHSELFPIGNVPAR